MPLPKPSDMFGDADNSVEIAERFESYKAELSKSLGAPQAAPGTPGFEQGGGESGVTSLQKALGSADVSKALSPELVDSVRNALAQSDVNKDWSTSSPISTGLVAFDLEAPAKILVPRPTPLRNRISRRKGVGLAHRFKRITGWTGSGTGGVGIFHPGITESTTTSFGSVSYLRGAKISYAGDDQAVNYKQFGVSDQVSWGAQFAGQGFDDIRQLSQTAVLWSSMLLEERMLLGGRGTDSGFAGAQAAPTGLSLTVRNAASNEVGNTANIATLYVRVTAIGVWGESSSSAEASTTGMSAATGKVVDITFTDAPGALGYKVYAGTTTGAANCYPAAIANSSATINAAPLAAGSSVPGQAITINFNGGGTGGAPNTGTTTPTSDTTAYAAGYDGILPYCTGSNAGYVKRLNNTLSGSDGTNIGNAFETAFASLYDSVKADPDEILANGNDRKQLSDQLKTQGSSSFRITLDNGSEAHNAQVGALVTGLQNEVTGKMVDVTVHPWLPQGNMPIISWTLPLPDSQISDVFAVYNVQDYMGIQWPVNQFAYETSSYWFGTFVCYAPAWCGAIQGVFKG